jgi:hypothetical protein
MPESEDTKTAANHSFPANTSRNSETMRKRKNGKSQVISQLLALEERKLNNWRRLCNNNKINYVYSGRRRLPLFDEFVASS